MPRNESKPLEVFMADLRDRSEEGKSVLSRAEEIVRECRELIERSQNLIQESRRHRTAAREKRV